MRCLKSTETEMLKTTLTAIVAAPCLMGRAGNRERLQTGDLAIDHPQATCHPAPKRRCRPVTTDHQEYRFNA